MKLLAIAAVVATTFCATQIPELTMNTLLVDKKDQFIAKYIELVRRAATSEQRFCPIYSRHRQSGHQSPGEQIKYTFYYQKYKETDPKTFMDQLKGLTLENRAKYYIEIVKKVNLLEKAGFLVNLNLTNLVHLNEYFSDVRILPQIGEFASKADFKNEEFALSASFKRGLQTVGESSQKTVTNVFGVACFIAELEYTTFADVPTFDKIQISRMRSNAQNNFLYTDSDYPVFILRAEIDNYNNWCSGSPIYHSLLNYIVSGGGSERSFSELMFIIAMAGKLPNANRSSFVLRKKYFFG